VEAVREFVPELRRFAARRLGDWGNAEDAVQETLLRAWRSADQFDPARGTVRAWLFTILRNLLVDMARARSRRPRATSLDDGTQTPAVADDIEALLTSVAVAAALRELTVEQREVIDHCYFRARPHAEVARQLGIPVGTIRSRLFYARDALKRVLVDLEITTQPERQLT
jgi:RNA polymerase sigma-70 factor (ECF subfamily)